VRAHFVCSQVLTIAIDVWLLHTVRLSRHRQIIEVIDKEPVSDVDDSLLSRFSFTTTLSPGWNLADGFFSQAASAEHTASVRISVRILIFHKIRAARL